ncbi:MAG: Lrp/AsnC family transcriptional regulator [Gemmatimonadetes bacterium]|nr:Lrp/AsnC family transcriptional regulator [Gemmatimonadota bacterium]
MSERLDRIDARIVAELANEGRQSNKELAAKIDLAPSSCLERVRRLRATGVLRGFHADVDPEALGIGIQAMVAIRLHQHSAELARGFLDYARTLPEVLWAAHLAGENDYLLQVGVHDVAHLRDFTLDRLTARDEVAHVETALIFEQARRWEPPDYSGR